MNTSNKVMRNIPKLCLLVATLAVVSVWSGKSCERGQTWWDRENETCAPCTRCDHKKGLAVQYPCDLHMDTVCQPLANALVWPYETLDPTYDDDSEVLNANSDSEVQWDLQTSTLTLAASGCIVFFVVVLSLSLAHAKQWKVLKQALKSDVEDLSAKLKLMEAGDAPAEPVVPTEHHLYCNVHVGKTALLGSATSKGLGNVYTQEKHTP